MHVVATAKISEKHQQALRTMFSDFEFYFFDSMQSLWQEPEVIERAQVLLTYGEDLNEDVLKSFVNLRWIQVLSAGIDRMPHAALLERGIVVTNARGIHAIPMAEYAVGVILSHVRRLPQMYQFQREKRWDRSIRVEELYGKTIVIVGTGAIGQAIAARLLAFGVEVHGVNRHGKDAPGFQKITPIEAIDQALAKADGVIVTVPLTAESRHLFQRDRFEAMKRGAFFVNMGRGGVVEESHLLEALDHGIISYAYLDVFETEPLPDNHPFWDHPRIFLTPHVSGRSPYYMARALEIFKENVPYFLAGDIAGLKNLVDLTKGY